MEMRPALLYIPCAKSSKETTGDKITFVKFEERGLLTETCDNAEAGDKSIDNSIMPPLIRKEEMNAMNSGDESEDEPMSTKM